MPRGNVNVFNLSITFQGIACVFAGTWVGIGVYDAGALILIASPPARTDGLLFAFSP